MTETEANIRKSLLDTLRFLASEAAQREFAEQKHYASYHGEFACWWFDTFFPNEPSAMRMFTEDEFGVLSVFSDRFDKNLKTIGLAPLPIGDLLAKKEWGAVIESAREACRQLAIAA